MSIRHMNQVFEMRLRPAEKLSLLVFADLANERGICWPSLSYVSYRASVSVRGLQRIIQALEVQGLLQRQPRYRQDGSQTSSEFVVLPNVRGDKVTPPADNGVSGAGGGAPPGAAGDGHAGTPITTNDPQIDNHHHMGGGWIFPRALSKTEQGTAARLLAGIGAEEAQMILDELAGRISSGGIRSSRMAYLRTLVARAKSGQFIPEMAHDVVEKRAQSKRRAPDDPVVGVPASRETVERHLEELRRAMKRGRSI